MDLFIFGVLCVLIGLVYAVVQIADGFYVGAFIGLTFLAFPGVIFFLFWFYRKSLRVQVFEHGLLSSKEGKGTIKRWDEVEAIWQSSFTYNIRFIIRIPVYKSEVYTLKKKVSGEQLKIRNNIARVAQLGQVMQREILKHMLPKALEAYKHGETLQFGNLSLSHSGIGYNKKVLSWAELKDVEVAQGYIGVKKEGNWLKWANVAVARTPNFLLFVTLVDRILRERRQLLQA